MTPETDAQTDRDFFSTLDYDHKELDEVETAVARLATHVAKWRADASLWRGRCEGQTETIAYLKSRVETLERREVIDLGTAEVEA